MGYWLTPMRSWVLLQKSWRARMIRDTRDKRSRSSVSLNLAAIVNLATALFRLNNARLGISVPKHLTDLSLCCTQHKQRSEYTFQFNRRSSQYRGLLFYSQRQLQSYLNDNYIYRLTTTTRVVSPGLVLGSCWGGQRPQYILPLGGGINSF